MLTAGFSSLAYLKSRLLPQAAEEQEMWDAVVSRLGLAVAAKFEQFCNRGFERIVGQVEEYNARCLSVTLRRYPVQVVTSLQLRSFNGPLVAFTAGYSPALSAGVLNFATAPGSQTEQLVITYTGGYWLDPMDGTAQPVGSTILPDDLLELWVAECQAQAEARDLFGSVSLRKDATKAKVSDGLSATTTDGLRAYRRYSGQ